MMAARSRSLGAGTLVLYALVALALVLAIIRFAAGIGAISNLNQGYPWGFWIGFDILAGIALAAGGFVVAALVHIFGGRKYHALVRPAIFTALLGYLLFIAGLLVDIGRPWTFWHMIIYWHHESPMFEVGWCVMMYTSVLILEFAPVIMEKLGWMHLMALWRKWAPWAAWGMLTLFAFAMTGSLGWTAAIGGVLVIFQLLVQGGVIPQDRETPTILIMAGIMFSTMHQSSLGTVFTMVPHKLDPLWYTPILPILFYLSAIMAGLAMVIVESMWSARHFRRPPETHLLRGIARGLTWAIVVYLSVKVIDLVVRGASAEAFTFGAKSLAFWAEITIGLAIPLVLLLQEEVLQSNKGIFWSALFVVVGLIINRLNVAITGIEASYPIPYSPLWAEVAVSAGIVAAGILAYREVVARFPVLEEHPSAPAHHAKGERRAEALHPAGRS
jgi:formate dehydrogenase iron-sulfur subunit